MKISVIICTRNPRAVYLHRTLQALRTQTVGRSDWELLIIDNASVSPVADDADVSWLPGARTIVENELGLTPARLRGIRESSGDLLVFVDDDNVLNPDYLEQALRIHHQMPWLGAWGGHIEGEFECEVPEYARDFIHYLALRDVLAARWACDSAVGALQFAPCGAGMCVTRHVASAYMERLAADPRLAGLGRRGLSLVSCEDTDMALTACDLGLAVGVFPQLKMLHLIPRARLQRDYLINLVIGVDTSLALLKEMRCGISAQSPHKRRIPRAVMANASMIWRKLAGKWTAADQFQRDVQVRRMLSR